MRYLEMDRIKILTLRDGKNKTQRALKLCEEAGETAAAVLSETNAPGCEYKTLDALDVLEECCDTVIVALSILSHYGFDNQDIIDALSTTLDKWEKVIA